MDSQQPPAAPPGPDPPPTLAPVGHASTPILVQPSAANADSSATAASAAGSGSKRQKGKGKSTGNPGNPKPPQQQTQSKKAAKKAAAAGLRRDIQGPGAGSELYQRMNFLMQAAQLMAHQAGHIAPVEAQARQATNGKRKRTTPRVAKSMPAAAVARHLGREMMMTARKNALKIDPSVKHSMCRRCGTVMVPGLSMEVDVFEPFDESTHYPPSQTTADTGATDIDDDDDDDDRQAPTASTSKSNTPPCIMQSCNVCGFTSGHPVRPGHVPFHVRAAVADEPEAK